MTTDQRRCIRTPHSLLRMWVLLSFLFLPLSPALAQEAPDSLLLLPTALTEEGGRVELRTHLELLEDEQGNLTFEQIRSPEIGKQFFRIGDESPNFGFTQSVWWVRYTLKNPTDKSVDIIFRQDYPLIDYLDFWWQSPSGDWQQVASGDRIPFSQRPLDHRMFLFPVKLPPQQQSSYYLRFETDGSMNIGLFAHAPEDLMNMIGREYLALGIYYGGFIVLLIYNLIMYLTVRERTFAYYLIYVASYGLYMSVHNGLSFQYLWPDSPWLANQSLLFLLSLSLLGGLHFTRTILSSATISPRADRIAYILEICSVVCLVTSPFIPYYAMIVPLAVLTVIICIHVLVMAIIALSRGSGPARYYMTAFSALLGGVFIYMLKTFGLFPHNAFTQNAFQIGSLIEMVLLSLAVASRLNELKQETFADALTQLYNRRYFNDQVAAEFHKAQQQSQPLSLVVIDIDQFKQFNDTYGHAQGDVALKAVANILSATVRKPNIPCRYGGEEFVLILPNTDIAAVRTLSERIRSQVEKNTSATFKLTVSVGYATYQQGNFNCAEDLFVAADFALYTAKEAGRNQVMDYNDCDSKRRADHAGALLQNAQNG